MNKLLTKIVGVALGLSMTVGVGVAVASNSKEAVPVHATSIESSPATTIEDGSKYVIGDGTHFLGAKASNTWGTPQTLDDAYEFTADGSGTTGFGLNGPDGYLVPRTGGSSNTFYAYTSTVTKTLKLESGKIKSTSNTVYELRYGGSSGFRWYTNNNTTGDDAKIYKVLTNVSVTGVTLNKETTSIGVGGTETLTATIAPGTATDQSVTWKSYSDSACTTESSAVASVSNAGVVTGVSVGTAYIQVKTTDGGFTAKCTVTVTAPIAVTGVSLNKETTSIEVGNTETLTATVAPNDASNKSVTWKSYSDSACTTESSAVASVSNAGVVTAVSKGTSYIQVKTADGGFTAKCTVTVTAPSSVTFVAGTDKGSSTSQIADSVAKSGITMSSTKAAFATAEYRMYSGSTTTFTSTIGNIGEIIFTIDSGYSSSDISTEDGTWNASTATWTGDLAEVSFSLSAQVRVTQVVINLATSDPSVTVNPTSVALKTNESEGVQVAATVKNVDNPTFTWTPSVANKVTIEVVSTVNKVQTVAIKPDTDSAVDLTVTLTVGGASPALSPVDISVSITVPGPGESQGTAFTVTQAIAHIDSVISGGESTGNDGNYYYARGIVSSIYSSSVNNNGQISYYISDDGTTTTQLEAYNGKGLNGESFTSIDDIEVGDTVIIYGKLKKYNSTYEFDSNNHLVSQTKAPKVNSITLDPAIVTVAPEDAGDIVDLFTNITINQDTGSSKTVNDIVWTTADDAVFYIDGVEYLVAGAHKTSTTITATIGNISTTATINVVDPNHPFISYDSLTEWDLVSDPSTLVAGDRVILTGVKSDVTYAAGTYSGSGNNVPSDTTNTLTVSGTKVTAGVVSTMIYTLEEGTETGSVAFKDSTGKYLYAAGGTSSNHMKSQSSIDGNASFILNSDGTVVAQGTSTRNYMRYNNSSTSNLFSCYASNSTTGELVTFYKMASGTVDLDDTILNLVRSKMSTYKDEHNVDQYGLSICNYNGGSDLSTWNTTVANGFTSSIISTYHLADARANRAGNDVEKFLSAYDYVVENYGEDYDFLGRIASGKVTPIQQSKVVLEGFISQNAAAIISIIAVLSLSAVAGYFMLRKRKEQ